ncbi:MAG: hypothetical protein J2P25_13905 [Nocardiopsaceae bacterium]|nr:hypothetical protein [Nocardiopsaceae bacterium]
MGLAADPGVAKLSVSDYAQLGSLAEYLHLAVPDVRVTRSPGHSERGEQGALDVLVIAADSTVLAAVIKVLPEFLRSRKPGVTVTATVEKKRRKLTVTVTAKDAEDARQVVEKFLDE